jgi:hypothetical protein
MIRMFTMMALSLLKTQDNMVTPCSVKQNGARRKPCRSSLEVTICDLQSTFMAPQVDDENKLLLVQIKPHTDPNLPTVYDLGFGPRLKTGDSGMTCV